MPFYVSIPLPGPFRYSARIGRRRHAHNANQVGALMNIFIVWPIKLVIYMMWGIALGFWYCGVGLVQGSRAGYRAYHQWRGQSHVNES
jgi:hypothetical protein